MITIPLIANSLWLGTHCNYQNLKGNPNIDWTLRVGSSSSQSDPASHEDQYPQQSYALFSDRRSMFTAVTTWYSLGVPMVDVYRIAFFKPLEEHCLICDTGYDDSLSAKIDDFMSKTVKNIFWLFVLASIILNIKALHNFKNAQLSYDDRYPIRSAVEIMETFRPLTKEDYFLQFQLAFSIGVSWNVFLVFLGWLFPFVDEIVNKIFVF
jgi:hypothetical protein